MHVMKRLGSWAFGSGDKSQDPRTNEESSGPTEVANLENIPLEIICIIASYLPFRQFMALLQANTKFKKLLDQNDLWSCQIENFFLTSTHRKKPNCRRTFKYIYQNRKQLAPAKLAGFKSAYVPTKISQKSDDSEENDLRNIILDDTLFVYETKKSHNVNVVLSTYNGRPYFVRSIKISDALNKMWYHTPVLSAGLIFLFDEEPDLAKLSKYDSFTKKQWEELSAQYESIEALQRAGCPVVYFEGLEKELDGKLFINFDLPCLVATHFVLKMLRSCDESKEGMNVANFILYGGLAEATNTTTTWMSNAEPDDIDMGGLSDYDDYGDFE